MTRTHALSLSLSLAFAAAAAAGSAIADDITIDPNPFVSTASRAQVQEELLHYRVAGINPWADDYNPLAQFHGSMSRDQVVADFHASRTAVAAFCGEDSGSTYLARMDAPDDRGAIVVADAD